MKGCAVADAGFLEGFYYITARQFLKPHPLLLKPCPFSIVLERYFLLYLSIDPFSIEIFAKAS